MSFDDTEYCEFASDLKKVSRLTFSAARTRHSTAAEATLSAACHRAGSRPLEAALPLNGLCRESTLGACIKQPFPFDRGKMPQ